MPFLEPIVSSLSCSSKKKKEKSEMLDVPLLKWIITTRSIGLVSRCNMKNSLNYSFMFISKSVNSRVMLAWMLTWLQVTLGVLLK